MARIQHALVLVIAVLFTLYFPGIIAPTRAA